MLNVHSCVSRVFFRFPVGETVCAETICTLIQVLISLVALLSLWLVLQRQYQCGAARYRCHHCPQAELTCQRAHAWCCAPHCRSAANRNSSPAIASCDPSRIRLGESVGNGAIRARLSCHIHSLPFKSTHCPTTECTKNTVLSLRRRNP